MSQSRHVAPAAGPLRGRLRVPGDKSIAHRAVMFNAAAAGRATVRGLPSGRDVQSTVKAMRRLGARIDQIAPGTLRIDGRDLAFDKGEVAIDCENSGTTMRLLCGLLAGQAGLVATLGGDESLSRRPMRRVADPLASLGGRVETTDGHAPLKVTGAALRGAAIDLSVASAQLKSALLLAGLQAEGPTSVTEPVLTRDHTEKLLAAMGVPLALDAERCRISIDGPVSLGAIDMAVPGDPSSAAFLLVAATVVPGSDVTVEGVCLNPTRLGFLRVLERMGADVKATVEEEVGGEPVGSLRARHSALGPYEIRGDEVPATIDELPLLAVAAAFAAGESTLSGAGELRVKESDRIATTAAILRAFGVEAREKEDGLVVVGGRPRGGGAVTTHGDHRIAMSAAVAALACEGGVDLDDADAIAVSFPQFFRALESLAS